MKSALFRPTLLPLLLLLTWSSVAPAQFGFTTNNGAITITQYTGPRGVVVIPASTNGLPVTCIGTNAFAINLNVLSVVIPSSVTCISDSAFYDCVGLTNVAMGTNVTEIGANAFLSCKALTNISLPSSVTSIGQTAFGICSRLTAITVNTNNPVYMSVAGVLFDRAQTTLMEAPGALGTAYSIPSTVTAIGAFAFWNCTNLHHVVIPESVTNIGTCALFQCTGLTNVTIPASVTSVGDQVFCACSSLKGVFFGGDAPTFGLLDFAEDSLPLAYYLAGTGGWSNFWTNGVQAVLWNPQVQTGGPDFGVRAGRFGFRITGTANIPIVVDAATNLADASWTSLQACTITNGSIYFSDAGWTNSPARFYRIRSP